jgi:MerR family transcriptional regulator, copper efflux regulator
MSDLRISELAERTGVPATTLRFYDDAGLLPAARTPAGYRIYDEAAVERLEFIGVAKQLGLPLEEIAELLQVWADGSCSQVRDGMRPRLAARLAEAEQRTAELTAFTVTLRSAIAHLDALPDRAGRCGPRCGFLSPGDAHEEAWRTAPLACLLSEPDTRQRADQWRELLADARRDPIPDGMRLTVPAERAGQIAELAAAEQRCCAFFDFRLHLDRGQVQFDVRAPADAAGLLAGLFG